MPTTPTQSMLNNLGRHPLKRSFDKGPGAGIAGLCEKCDKPIDPECERCSFIGAL